MSDIAGYGGGASYVPASIIPAGASDYVPGTGWATTPAPNYGPAPTAPPLTPSPPTPTAPPATPSPPVQVQDRTPLHTVDSGPKTGTKGSHIVVVFFIAIVCIIAIIMLVVGFQLKDATQTCSQNESLNCYTLTCGSNSLPVATCGQSNPQVATIAPPNGQNYAYRCTSKTTLQCNWNPGVDLTIVDADKGICDNFVASS